MGKRAVRFWSIIHTWSSLICTAFLLLLCLTGLPLIFQEEISHWTDPEPPYAAMSADAPLLPIDRLVADARMRWPGHLVTSVSLNPDEPEAVVGLTPSWKAYVSDPAGQPFIGFDRRSGGVREVGEASPDRPLGFIGWMYRLHIDLFLDIPGQMFLLVMGLLFVAAIISGTVLYGPFTRKLPYGAIRRERSRRVRWLDLHNLLGVSTLVWTVIVGFTGSLNNLESPLFQHFLAVDVPKATSETRSKLVGDQAKLSPIAPALEQIRARLPGQDPIEIVFPGNPYGAASHYMVWLVGRSPLTRQMETAVLVDGATGRLVAKIDMPWYLKAIEVSRPLHFGNYGGLPMKLLWALLDIVTIAILVTGLWLWLARRRSRST